MNLNDALDRIAKHLGLDSAELVRYAAEDDLGGFHFDAAFRRWPQGSLWEDEGKALYALVRALMPEHMLELGVHVGASTSHLRRAVQKNGYGWVNSVDKWEGAGGMIPPELNTVGAISYCDALEYITFIATLSSAPMNFVFEDLCHEEREVYDILTAIRPKLAKGAVIVHHDSEHGAEGEEVRRGIKRAGITDYVSLLIGDSDCGLAVYRL